MAKQQSCQKYIFKIHSRRLAEANWNLSLSIAEARKNKEIISLASSQTLRFIDDINKIGDQEQEVKAKALKRRIRMLRKEKNSLENRHEIKRLYSELDKLQFKPDYMCLIIDRKKDYMRATSKKGFRINGIKYERLLGTTGGIKNNTIVFVSSELTAELRRRIDNGRDMQQMFIPAKLEAYRALACSASTPVSDPDGVLVVNDCMTTFKDNIIMIDDSGPGEPELKYIDDYECTLDASDGFGLMSYELAQQWSEDLQLSTTISGCCIRNSFCKGMVFPFPFREFARKVAGKNMVQDAWGDWKDIHRVQLILTTSMLKLWDSYDSCEDYLENCKENGYTFAVTKTCELQLENERNLNYQFIQSYHLTNEQINELVAPTLDEFKAVLGGDWASALLFLRGSGMRDDERYFNSLDDDFIKALMVEPELIHDKYVQDNIYSMLRRRIDRAKTGVLKVHGNFQVMSGDPYSLCQSMFGIEVTGLLKAGEFYSKFWDDRGTDKAACFRAPMTSMNNIRLLNVNHSDECRKWYRYMKTVSILNSWDNTGAAMNGADFDGDLMFSTDNKVLVDNHRDEPAILCAQKSGCKTVPSENDFIQSNINGFGDSIGKITNRITTMFNVQSQYEQGSEEYEILDYRIKCGQLYQQNSIDRIKGIKTSPMPKYWYDYGACRVSKDDTEDVAEDKRLNQRILANKKPYFMAYIYPAQMKDYKKYRRNVQKKTMREIEQEVEAIFAKPHEQLTPYESNLVQYYFFKNPVGMNLCTMNRICWTIEDEMDKYMKRRRAENNFDYDTLKSGVEYKPSVYYQVKKIFEEYLKRTSSEVKERAVERVDNEEYLDQFRIYVEEIERELLSKCSSDDMLCDILIDICKAKGSSYSILWILFPDRIVKNLLARHKNKAHVIVKDEDGDIVYGSERYKDVIIEVGGDAL